jgi:hypothetical protein
VTTKTMTSETAATVAVAFSKKQVLLAKKYADRRDLLTVLLAEDRPYTLAEVDRLIDDFMKKEVK